MAAVRPDGRPDPRLRRRLLLRHGRSPERGRREAGRARALPPDRVRPGRGAERVVRRVRDGGTRRRPSHRPAARRRPGERRPGRPADAVAVAPEARRGRRFDLGPPERAAGARRAAPDVLARGRRRRARRPRAPLRAGRDRGRRQRGDAPPEAADRDGSAPGARARAPRAHRVGRARSRDALRRRRRADRGARRLPPDRAEQHGGLQPARLEGRPGKASRTSRTRTSDPHRSERHEELPHRLPRARGPHARVPELPRGGALPDRRRSAPRRPPPRVDAEERHVDRAGPDVRQGSADAHDGDDLPGARRLGRDRLLRERQRRPRLERDAVRRARPRRHTPARARAAARRQGAGRHRRRAPRHPLAPGRSGLERQSLCRDLRRQPRSHGAPAAPRDPRGPERRGRARRRGAGTVHRRDPIEGARTNAATSASTASPSASSTPPSAPSPRRSRTPTGSTTTTWCRRPTPAAAPPACISGRGPCASRDAASTRALRRVLERR